MFRGGIKKRYKTGKGSVSHLSLARTAAILTDKGVVPEQGPVIQLPVQGPCERIASTRAVSVRSGVFASRWRSRAIRSFGTTPPGVPALRTPNGHPLGVQP
jgi:hypothetical protein